MFHFLFILSSRVLDIPAHVVLRGAACCHPIVLEYDQYVLVFLKEHGILKPKLLHLSMQACDQPAVNSQLLEDVVLILFTYL